MYKLYFVCRVALLVLLGGALHAQPWFQTRAGSNDLDRGASGRRTSSNQFLVGGDIQTPGSANVDAVLSTWTGCGTPLLQLEYGTPNSVERFLKCIEVNNPAGYICVGVTDRNGTDDAYIIRTDVNGTVLFSGLMGTNAGWDEFRDVIQTSDGGYAMCGLSTDQGTGATDAWAVKLNASYGLQWSLRIGPGTGLDRATALTELNSSILVTGVNESLDINPNSLGDIFVSEHDLSSGFMGNLWLYGGNGTETAMDITTFAGECFLTGFSNTNTAGGSDFFFLRLDHSLLPIAYTQYGSPAVDRGRAIDFNPSSGDWAIAGTTFNPGFGGADGFMATVDFWGNLIPANSWQYGTAVDDRIMDLQVNQTNADHFMVGTTLSGAVIAPSNIWMLNTTPAGSTNCQEIQFNPVLSATGTIATPQNGTGAGPTLTTLTDAATWIALETNPFCVTGCKRSGARDAGIEPEPALTLAPNPATNRITVGHQAEGLTGLRVMDIQGRELMSWSWEAAHEAWEIDLTSLNAGVYFLSAETADGNTWEARFVKH